MTQKKKFKGVTREALLDRLGKPGLSLKKIPVDVPEWDMTIYLRELSAGEQNEITEKSKEKARELKKDGLDLKGEDLLSVEESVAMLQLCIVDEDGNQMLKKEEVELLMQQSGKLMTDLLQKASSINEPKKAKEIEKN